jgi:chemotaxis protein histidine kinase CheA
MRSRPGSGAPVFRPDLERLRRVAALSLSPDDEDRNDGGDKNGSRNNNDVSSLVPYDSAPSPSSLLFSTDAEEKAAYAARIRAVALSTKEEADSSFAKVRELFDKVKLSSVAGPYSSAAVPPPPNLPPPPPFTTRPPPWSDALMAAASAEELRLLSQLRAEREARRLLTVRAGIREAKEKESSLLHIAEGEKEVKAARAAVGRAAARAEREAAERAASAKKEASARLRAEAKARAEAEAQKVSEASKKAAAAAAAAANDEILILSDSDDDVEAAKPKPVKRKSKPAAANDDDGAVLLLSSDDDEEEEEEEAKKEDLSSAFESGLALAGEEEEDEDSSVPVDPSALASMAVSAGLPPSTSRALARLTPRQRRACLAALSNRLPNGDAAVVAVHHRTGVPLTRGKAASLIGKDWLNDEVMNMYLDGLQDRDIAWRRKRMMKGNGNGNAKNGAAAASNPTSSSLPPPRAHFFSTFFLAKLFSPKRGEHQAYEYQGVRRWTGAARLHSIYCCSRPAKQEAAVAAQVVAARAAAGISSSSSSSSIPPPPARLDAAPPCLLTECDLLVFPVHLGVHWATAVIDLNKKQIDYYDSMNGQPRQHLSSLQRWLFDEASDKLPSLTSPAANPLGLTAEDFRDWPIRCLDPSIVPQQGNGSDCGVFALRFAEALGRGCEVPDFSQSDMESLRLVVAADLVTGTISATPKRKK